MDWKALIADITASGLTQAEIATRVGSAQSAISDLVTGKTMEPRFSTGQKLVEMRRQQIAKKSKGK